MTVTGKKLEGYTPGPWTLAGVAWQDNFSCWSHPIHTTYPGGGHVAHGRTPEEATANAALIAQAPTLLEQRGKLVEALRDALVFLDMHYDPTDTDPAMKEMAKSIKHAERVLREVGE